jgi:hypothetical protein
MRRAFPLLIGTLAACGSGERHQSGAGHSAKPVQTATLTGAYEERVNGEQRARMCMLARPSGTASFALVSQMADGRGCGGAGDAARSGNSLRVTMSGDSECVIEARMTGSKLVFPPQSSPRMRLLLRAWSDARRRCL